MSTPEGVAAAPATTAIGSVLGRSDAIAIGQETISAFATVTGDQQWIHVDEERARTSRYRSTIAHGYLVLALLPQFTRNIVDFSSQGTVINYGLNRVRFLGAATSGSSFCDEITLQGRTERHDGTLYELEHKVTDAASGELVCSAHTLTLVLRST